MQRYSVEQLQAVQEHLFIIIIFKQKTSRTKQKIMCTCCAGDCITNCDEFVKTIAAIAIWTIFAHWCIVIVARNRCLVFRFCRFSISLFKNSLLFLPNICHFQHWRHSRIQNSFHRDPCTTKTNHPFESINNIIDNEEKMKPKPIFSYQTC